MEKTILIVDDEPIIRQSFTDFFEDDEWTTLGAKSGEEAMRILSENRVSAAIVDIRLGGMRGDTFIREVYDLYPHMVFVVYTGSLDYHFPQDLLSLDRVSQKVFSKPVKNMISLEKELLRLLHETVTGSNPQ